MENKQLKLSEQAIQALSEFISNLLLKSLDDNVEELLVKPYSYLMFGVDSKTKSLLYVVDCIEDYISKETLNIIIEDKIELDEVNYLLSDEGQLQIEGVITSLLIESEVEEDVENPLTLQELLSYFRFVIVSTKSKYLNLVVSEINIPEERKVKRDYNKLLHQKAQELEGEK